MARKVSFVYNALPLKKNHHNTLLFKHTIGSNTTLLRGKNQYLLFVLELNSNVQKQIEHGPNFAL